MQAPPGSGDQANCNTRVVKITKHNEPLGATVRWRYWSSNCTGCLTGFSGLYWKVQMIGNFGWSWAIFVLLGNFGPFKLFWTILGHFGSFGPFWCLWAFFLSVLDFWSSLGFTLTILCQYSHFDEIGPFEPFWTCTAFSVILGLLSHYLPFWAIALSDIKAWLFLFNFF